MGFREYMKEYCPPWLQGANGLAWVRALGDVKDGMTAALKERVAARFPIRPDASSLPAIAPTGALEALGREQQMPRALGESDAEYAARLADAFDIWSYAGTAYGLLLALKAAGFGTARVCIAKSRRYHLDASGALVVETLPAGAWCTEPLPAPFWSRFVVLFDAATGLPADWYGTPVFYGLGTMQKLFDPIGTSAQNPTVFIDETTTNTPSPSIADVRVRIPSPVADASMGFAYEYSLDGGTTWLAGADASDTAIPPSFHQLTTLGSGLGDPIGLGIQFADGDTGFYSGDEVYKWPLLFTPSIVVPGEEALRMQGLRQHIAKWKAAASTCVGIVIVEAGYCFDTLPASFTAWAAAADLSGNVVYDYHP